MSVLALRLPRRYGVPVTVNPVADLGRSKSHIGAQAPTIRMQALFLCLPFRVMAAVRGTPSGVPGSYVPGRPTRVQLPPQFAWPRTVTAPHIGAPPMQTLNPSRLRAAAHRRMAFAALRADSSAATRLARYQHHITKARALESKGGGQ